MHFIASQKQKKTVSCCCFAPDHTVHVSL